MSSANFKHDYKQAVIWAPATLVPIGLAIAGWVAQGWGSTLQIGFGVIALVLFFMAERWLTYQIRVDAISLRWRWGIFRPGVRGELMMNEIHTVEVVTLPDQPRQPVRVVEGIEIHGGNFTPSLNRGIRVKAVDGKVFCFGLNDPEKCAEAIRHFKRLADEAHANRDQAEHD
ncbi:hypothetical protein KSF73_01930 [Burkholderiaceae bacterium DAT-1]|nr:hypothetical protein [Burkholderiaceae bacterium DAT-1]